MTGIAVVMEVDTDASGDQLERLVTLAERHCVIAQTLISPPAVEVSGRRASA